MTRGDRHTADAIAAQLAAAHRRAIARGAAAGSGLGAWETRPRAALFAAERARWGASFEAWRLGADAQALPAADRAAGFDRALDAFAALIATPIDPGNDEGPCWAIAHDLSLPQVRRALAILAQMNARDWCYQLAGSKAALLTRLAALGELDEARAVLRSIDPDGEFAATWRATAWGGLIAGQLAHAATLTVAAALRDAAAEDPVSLATAEGRLRALAELHYRAAQLRPLAHAAAIAAGCIDEVVALRRLDPRLGRIALEDCMGAWGPIAPLDRWLALIADEPAGADRVELLETLLVEQPAAAPALIAELARTPSPYPAATLRLLLEQPTAVPPAALWPTWDAWLAAADSPGFARTIIDGRDALAAAVAHLGGPAAAARACHALAALGDAG